MLIDGRFVPNGGILQAEVVVIGAGPAGIAIAQELGAAGVNTLLLEGGGRWHNRSENDSFEGASVGKPFPLVVSRQRGFGGTSGHWAPSTGLRVRPLDEVDFEPLSSRPGCSWPFGRVEMDGYYARASTLVNVRSTYDAADWPDLDDTRLTWPSGPQIAVYQFADHDVFTREFDDLTACPTIDLVLHANVSELVSDADSGAITSAEVVTRDHNRFSVSARVFVLACGGIDNARVLLSSHGRSGLGVGNEHDIVGRYFMDHISVDCGSIEPIGNPIEVSNFLETISVDSGKHQAMLWLGDDVIRREGLLNAAFWIYETDPGYLSPGVTAARSLRAALRSRPLEYVGRHALGMMTGAADIAPFAVRKITRRSPRQLATSLRILAEQRPDPNSRIRLADERDAHGVRRVHMDWRIADADLASIVGHREVLGRLLETAGVGRIVDRIDATAGRSPVLPNYHHMGSTRMHVSAAKGVVDAECRVHSSSNLYVAGSSVFPAGGYLNPTLTIIALALRIADAVKRDIRPIAATTVV